MNTKAEASNVLWVVIGLVFVLLLIVLGLFVVDKTRFMIFGIGSFASCEKGAVGYYGMCMHSSMVCKGEQTSEADEIGSLLSGCPSTKIEQLFKGEFSSDKKVNKAAIAKYTQCCIVKKCEDISDRKDNTLYPREPRCFDEEECTGNKVDDKYCLGYADDCKKDDGCCCVQPFTVKNE